MSLNNHAIIHDDASVASWSLFPPWEEGHSEHYLSSTYITYPGVGSPSSVASSSSTSGTQAGPGSNPLSRELRSRQFFSPLSEKGGVENGEKDIAAAIFSPLSEKGSRGDRRTGPAIPSSFFFFSFFPFFFSFLSFFLPILSFLSFSWGVSGMGV